jgi:3-hydroxyisobutyrate dehydrogenase-like beta-hydroxyacid dehydrogenase
MAATLAEKGVQLLDAPISGGQIGAVEAKLSIMVIHTIMSIAEGLSRPGWI